MRDGRAFHEIVNVSRTGNRPVTLRDARKVVAFPSVTNILGVLAKPELTILQSFGTQREFSPPACPNANADVERIDPTIETELFDAQVVASKTDYFAKTTTYRLWHNAARKNSSRDYEGSADPSAVKAPSLSPKIFLLHPLNLGSHLPTTG